MQSCVGNFYWKVLKFIGNICQLPQSSLAKLCWKFQLKLNFSTNLNIGSTCLRQQLHLFFKAILITSYQGNNVFNFVKMYYLLLEIKIHICLKQNTCM